MNIITIWAPKWSTRKCLLASWKIGDENQVDILAKRKDGSRYYPNPFYISGGEVQKYPLVQHPHGKFWEVPFDALGVKRNA